MEIRHASFKPPMADIETTYFASEKWPDSNPGGFQAERVPHCVTHPMEERDIAAEL
jgi:hypothetical protein